VVDGMGKPMNRGNHFWFYEFRQRYWLTIYSPFTAYGGDGATFAFLIQSPHDVASGRVPSLFAFGCHVEAMKAP
jgi:hypothetical protein